MLTTFDRSKLVYDSLLAGASGFLLKDAPSRSWSLACEPSLVARSCSHRASRGD